MAEVGKDLRNVLAEAFHFIEGKQRAKEVNQVVQSYLFGNAGARNRKRIL